MANSIIPAWHRPSGYVVVCTAPDGLRVYVDGWSARDSAEEFARDPRNSGYRHWLSDEDAAWLFEYCEREVCGTVRP